MSRVNTTTYNITLKMRNRSSTHLGPAPTLHVTNKQMSNCCHECDWHYYEKLFMIKQSVCKFPVQSSLHTVNKSKNSKKMNTLTFKSRVQISSLCVCVTLDLYWMRENTRHMNAWDNYGVLGILCRVLRNLTWKRSKIGKYGVPKITPFCLYLVLFALFVS